MNKVELRNKYLKVRKEIKNKNIKDIEIFHRTIDLLEYKKCKLVLTYVSLDDEVDTIKLIKYSLNIGKKVAVPKCENEIINFYYISSLEDLSKGNYGILEPKGKNIVSNFESSICIVPGICFDKEGNRIGYGKGYYDKFLIKYRGIKIGLTYRECIVNKIDIYEHDIKMDKVI